MKPQVREHCERYTGAKVWVDTDRVSLLVSVNPASATVGVFSVSGVPCQAKCTSSTYLSVSLCVSLLKCVGIDTGVGCPLGMLLEMWANRDLSELSELEVHFCSSVLTR